MLRQERIGKQETRMIKTEKDEEYNIEGHLPSLVDKMSCVADQIPAARCHTAKIHKR